MVEQIERARNRFDMTGKSLLVKEYERRPGFRHHSTAREGLDDVSAGRGLEPSADGLDSRLQIVVGRPEVDQQHLVLLSVDRLIQQLSKGRAFRSIKLAEEHAELRVVAEIL